MGILEFCVAIHPKPAFPDSFSTNPSTGKHQKNRHKLVLNSHTRVRDKIVVQ